MESQVLRYFGKDNQVLLNIYLGDPRQVFKYSLLESIASQNLI
jgi:hypothetical protein